MAFAFGAGDSTDLGMSVPDIDAEVPMIDLTVMGDRKPSMALLDHRGMGIFRAPSAKSFGDLQMAVHAQQLAGSALCQHPYGGCGEMMAVPQHASKRARRSLRVPASQPSPLASSPMEKRLEA